MAAPDLTSQAALSSVGAPPACQLARVQLRRYMAGDEIPEPLLEELRSHLNECEGCKSESVRLRDALASVAPGTSPAPGSVPAGTRFGLMDRLLAMIPAIPEGRLKSALKAPKTVGLSIGLAVVVVLLSTVFRNPTAALGPKASESATLAKEAEAAGEEQKDAAAHGDESTAEDESEPATDAKPTADDHGDATEDEVGHSGSSAHRSSEEEHGGESVDPTVGGKVVVVGGSSHEPAVEKTEATKPKLLVKPRTTTTRRTSTKSRRTSSPPAVKSASKPAPKAAVPTPNEPYVKVYK